MANDKKMRESDRRLTPASVKLSQCRLGVRHWSDVKQLARRARAFLYGSGRWAALRERRSTIVARPLGLRGTD
jgi:hypothetical protein